MSDLKKKLNDWLSKQGYPTEFQTANIFRKAGFHVRQGFHVGRGESGSPREIDVLADATTDIGKKHSLRISHVVECKWALDKPWVIFSDPQLQLNPAALVSQSIGSSFGGCLLWVEAGNKDLHKLGLFHTPKRAGFGGRQAFTEADNFYAAMHAVTQHAVSVARRHDDRRTPKRLPHLACIAFPIIVVEGLIYEAFFCPVKEDVVLEEVDCVRCHWRGSAAWSVFATVDIVSLKHLQIFITRRNADVKKLLKLLRPTAEQMIECFEAGSLKGLKISEGSRGMIGLPKLLRELKGSE